MVSTSFFHDLRNGRVMNMTNRWEQVVFFVKIQPTKKPTHDWVASAIVYGHFCLVNGPRTFHLAGALPGDREFCLFHAVRQLEHNAYGRTQHQDANAIVKYNDRQRVEEKWYHKYPREKDGLATNEDCQFPRRRSWEPMASDSTRNNISEIINKLPLYSQ